MTSYRPGAGFQPSGLRRGHGESPELVQLAGTYHNLLRRWAEV